MLLAGMATRTFCATASPTPEKPIQKKAASVTPYRKTSFSVARLASVFIAHSRVRFALSQLGKLAKSMETESCCQLKCVVSRARAWKAKNDPDYGRGFHPTMPGKLSAAPEGFPCPRERIIPRRRSGILPNDLTSRLYGKAVIEFARP